MLEIYQFMNTSMNPIKFAELFKKYRLRSEIESLEVFGDLLSNEGLVYETSLFTRWQRGDRIPRDRRTLIGIITVFSRRMGITTDAANRLLEAAGQGYLTETEKESLPGIIDNVPQQRVLQASLGGLLKDYRLQKNIPLLEVALDLGLEDSKLLDELENGYVKPDRNILDRICKALSLKDQEKNYLLLVGDFLPTQEEMRKIAIKVQPTLDSWPYPATLLDYSWRVVSDNVMNAQMWGIPLPVRSQINATNPRVIELLFNRDIPAIKLIKGEDLIKWQEWLTDVLVYFRFAQQNRQNSDWYIDFLRKMMKSESFRDSWAKSMSVDKETIVTNHGLKFIYSTEEKQYINVFYSVVPLLSDPRFSIEFHSPVDLKSFKFFQKI